MIKKKINAPILAIAPFMLPVVIVMAPFALVANVVSAIGRA